MPPAYSAVVLHFPILAFVELFGADIDSRVIGADIERLVQRKPISVAPVEFAVLPVQVGTVSVREQYASAQEER